MFEDIIFELEECVRKATDSLTHFENKIGDFEDELTNAQLSSFQEMLSENCEALTGILKVFTGDESESPLHIIKNKIGPTLLGIDEKDFDQLLNAEKALLKRIGLSEKSITSTIEQMEQIKNDLLLTNESFDPNDVIKTLEEFKSIICEISKIGELQNDFVNLELVKLCVKGLVDVCVVSGDILSVFTVPDPTPFTFLRSVKSVYSGVKSLKNISEKLGNKYRSYMKLIRSKKKHKALRKRYPSNRLKRK